MAPRPRFAKRISPLGGRGARRRRSSRPASTKYGCAPPSMVSVRSPRGPETTSASTCPVRMASSVASASSSRSRIFAAALRRLGARPRRFTATALRTPHVLRRAHRAQVQPDQRALGVGEIADQLANRLGKSAHQRREREDLIALAPTAGASGDRSPRCGIVPADAPRRFASGWPAPRATATVCPAT